MGNFTDVVFCLQATKLAKKDRELAKETLKRAEEKAKSIEGKSIATAEERTRKVESDAKAKIAEAKSERARLVAAAEDKVKRVEAEARSKEIASRKRLKDAEAKLEQLAFERNDLTRQIAASSGAMAKAMAAMAERSHQSLSSTSNLSNVSSPSDKSPRTRQRSTMFNTSSPRTATSPRPPRSPQGVALPGMVEAARRLKEATSTSHSELNRSVGLNHSSSASLRLSSSASPSSATGKQSQSPDGAARLRSLSAALRTKSTEVEHIRSAVSSAVSGLMTSPAPKGPASVEGSEASVAGESPGVNWGVSPVNAHAPTPTSSNANHRPSPLTLPVETIDEDAHCVNADDGATGKQSELDLIDLNTPASESARRARESLEHARSIVKRLNSPPSTLGARGGHVQGSSSRPPPSPATRGTGMGAADPGVDAEVGGSEVARNFVRGGRGRAADPSSPVARGLAMFDSPGRTQ